MAASRYVEVTDKEISEIKINSIPKTQKTCVKILKQLFASGLVIIIGEYSPRLRLGEYSPIITSPRRVIVKYHSKGIRPVKRKKLKFRIVYTKRIKLHK
jgi:hypothetical protein